MTDKISKELKDELEAALSAGVTDNAIKALKKKVDDILCTIEDDITYRIQDELAPQLTAWVERMASDAVEQLLAGNVDQMRRYLACSKPYANYYTGRSDGYVGGNWGIDQQHPIIHFNLSDNHCIELRRKIVDAHRELLVNERILDLEDQVKSLVAQVNKANAERQNLAEKYRQDYRDYRV